MVKRTLRTATPAFLAVGLVASVIGGQAYGAGTPANKVAASGSSVDEVSHIGTTILLQEQIKMSNPTDLILSATAECALTTQVTSSANGTTDRAFGEVTIWLTLDGIVVPIESADYDFDNSGPTANSGPGEVVLCNRAQEQQWHDAAPQTIPNPNPTATPTAIPSPDEADEDDDDQLRQRLDTMTANGFNWMALNVGTNYDTNNDNIIDVVLYARHRTETMNGNGAAAGELADAYVGARTLILEPVKAANREQVTDVGPGPQ